MAHETPGSGVDSPDLRRTLGIDRPLDAAYASSFLFAMPRGGSKLINGLVRGLCAEAGVSFIDVHGSMFAAGLPAHTLNEAVAALFEPRGYCYAGFRKPLVNADGSLIWNDTLDAASKVVLVRDPRDVLVSHFFAMRTSHPTPGEANADVRQTFDRSRASAQAQTIDEYALQVRGYVGGIITGYAAIADRGAIVLRYEDALYDKPAALRTMRDALALSVDDEACARIAKPWDRIPDTERPDQDLRKAHPGDHADKLQPCTIDALNEAFGPVLSRFGYAERVVAAA